MRICVRRLGIVLLSVACVSLATPATAELPDGASRYHAALLQRPSPGYLFDRFCRAWLAEASSGELDAFLAERADGGGVNDRLLYSYWLAQKGESVDAISVLRETLEDHPGSADAWFEKAKLEAASLDFDTALSDLEAAKQAQGADDDLLLDIAKLESRVRARTGDREGAMRVMAAFIDRNPGDALLREDLIYVQVDEGLFEEAIASLNALIEQSADPRDRVKRQLWLADIQLRANKSKSALETYKETLSSVGRETWLEREVVGRIDSVFRRRDDLQGLSKELESLIEAEPLRLELRRASARTLEELGDIDASVEQWQEIISATPGERRSRFSLIDLMIRSERYDDASTQLQAFAEQTGNDPALSIRLAEVEALAGRAEEAVAAAKSYVEQSGGSLSDWLRALRVVESAQDTGVSLAFAESMVESNPNDRETRWAFSESLARLDQGERAAEVWNDLGATAETVLDVERAASNLTDAGESAQAFTLLETRQDEFEDDTRFLRVLSDIAIRADRFAEATASARRWARLSEEPAETFDAVRVAVNAIVGGELEVSAIEELEALANERSVGETCLLAALYEETGRPDRTDRVLEEWAGRDERIARIRIRVLEDRGLRAKAASELARLVDADPGASPSDVRHLVRLLTRSGQITEALARVQRWKERTPNSVAPWLLESSVLSDAMRDAEAINALERAARRFPDDVSLAMRLGSAYRNDGRYSDAERIYWRLYESDDSARDRVRWATELANVAERSGGIDRLTSLFEERAARNRESVDAWLALAAVHRVRDDYDARRNALLEASRIEPGNTELLLMVADVEADAYDVESAIATLERAIENDPSGRARDRLARVLIDDAQIDAAMRLIVNSDPSPDADAMLTLARSLSSKSEWEAVQSLAREMLTLHPDHAGFIYLLGVAQSERGETTAAFESMLTLLDLEGMEPSPDSAWSSLGWQPRMMGDAIPRESLQLLSQLTANSVALRHRMGNRYWGQQSQGVVMPEGSEITRMFAVSHLCDFAAYGDESDRERVVRELRMRNIPAPEMIIDAMVSGEHASFSPAFFDDHLEHEEVLPLYALYASYREFGSSDTEVLERADAIYGDAYPSVRLATRLAVCHTASVDDDEAWSGLAEAVRDLEQPTSIDAYTIASFLGGISWRDSGTEVPEEHYEAMRAALRDCIDGLDANDPYYEYTLLAYASILAGAGDAEGLAEVLGKEIERHAANPSSKSGGSFAGYYSMRSYNHQRFEPLEFPPLSYLTTLPPFVGMVLSPESSGALLQQSEIKPGQLREALGEDADPILLAIVSAYAGDGEQMMESLKPLLTGDSPNLDAHLIAASWHGDQSQPQQAVKTLEQASFLPMTREMRERVDEAIVAYTLVSDLDDSSREIAQRSALRLLYASKDASLQQELPRVLTLLGLDEQAEQQRDKLAASSAQSMVATPGMFGGGGGQPSVERVREMFEADRREAAIRLATRELDSFAQQRLSSLGNYRWGAGQYAPRLVSILQRYKAIEEVLQEADPGESASAQRAAVFGASLEVVGETARALEVYERSMKRRVLPQTATRVVLLRLEAGEPEPAARALAAVEPRDLTTTLQGIMMEVSNSRDSMNPIDAADFALLISGWAAATEWTDINATTAAMAFPQALSMLNPPPSEIRNAGNPLGWNGNLDTQIPERAYEVREKLAAEEEIAPENERLVTLLQDIERRRDAHTKVAEQMARVPGLESKGFESLLVVAEAQRDDLSPYIELAQQTALASPRRARSMNPNQYAMMSYYSHRNYLGNAQRYPTVRERSPLEFIAWQATDREDVSLVDGLAERLIAEEHEDAAELLRAYHAVYSGQGEAFRAGAKTLLDMPESMQSTEPEPVEVVVGVMSARGIDPLLIEEDVLEMLEGSEDQSQAMMRMMMMGGNLPTSSANRYLVSIAKTHGEAEAVRVLDRIAVEWLGEDEATRERLIKRYVRAMQSGSYRPGQPAQQYVSLLQSLLTEPATMWAAYDALRVIPGQEDDEDLASGVVNSFRNEMYRRSTEWTETGDITPLAELVDNRKFLGGVDGFDPVLSSDWHMQNNSVESLLEMFVTYLPDVTSDENQNAAAALADWIEREADQTFGAALVASMLRKGEFADVAIAIEPWIDDVKTADRETINRLALLIPTHAFNEDALEPLQAELHRTLRGAAVESLTEGMEEFITRDRLGSSYRSNQAVSEAADLTVRALRDGQRELAERVFEHGVSLASQDRSNGLDEARTRLEIGSQVGRGAETTVAAVPFVLQRLLIDDGVALDRSALWGIADSIGSSINTLDDDVSEELREELSLESESKPISNRQVSVRRVLLSLEEAFEPYADEVSAPLLVPPVASAMRNRLGMSEREAVAAWTAAQPDDTDGYWRAMRAAAALTLRYSDEADEDEVELQNHRTYLDEFVSAFISDDTVPALVRCAHAGHMLGMANDSLWSDVRPEAQRFAVGVCEANREQLASEWLNPILFDLVDFAAMDPAASDALVDAVIAAFDFQATQPRRWLYFSLPRSFSHASTRSQTGKPTNALELLAATLATGDKNRLVRLLDANKSGLRKNRTALAMLVESGRDIELDEAAESIRRYWASLEPTFVRGSVYTPEMHDGLTRLLERIEDPENRLLAEAVITTVPDPEREDDESSRADGVPAYGDRSESLLERVLAAEFSNELKRFKCALMLSPDMEDIGDLRDIATAAAADMDLARLAEQSSNGLPLSDATVVHLAIRAQLAHGETDFAIDQFRSLHAAATGHSSRYSHSPERFRGRLLDMFERDIPQMLRVIEPEQTEGAIELLHAVADPDGEPGEMTFGRTINVVGHVLLDKQQDLAAWIESMPEDRRESLRSANSVNAYRMLWWYVMHDDMSDDARLDVITRVISDPNIRPKEGDLDWLIWNIAESDLLSEEEFARHADEWAEVRGDGALLSVAYTAGKFGMQDLAAEMWTKALEVCEPDARLRHYWYMIQTGAYRLALEELERFEPETDRERERTRNYTRMAREAIDNEDRGDSE